MKNHGYTLVELLVVVAIVAILAAMIAPVLLQAKEAARSRSCAANLRQLGHAINRYMDDHDGYGLPSSPPEYRNSWVLWVGPLIPGYISQAGVCFRNDPDSPYPYDGTPLDPRPKWIWVCPGDDYRGPKPPPTNSEVEYPCWFNYGSSYLYPGPTAYLSGKNYWDKTKTYPRKLLMWKRYSRDILLADYYIDMHSGAQVDRKAAGLTPYPNTWVSVKSINVLFLDSHMGMVSAQQRVTYQGYVINEDNPYK